MKKQIDNSEAVKALRLAIKEGSMEYERINATKLEATAESLFNELQSYLKNSVPKAIIKYWIMVYFFDIAVKSKNGDFTINEKET